MSPEQASGEKVDHRSVLCAEAALVAGRLYARSGDHNRARQALRRVVDSEAATSAMQTEARGELSSLPLQ